MPQAGPMDDSVPAGQGKARQGKAHVF